MIRSFALAAALSCVTSLVLAQTPPPAPATASVKPAARKLAPKTKPIAAVPPETGPCQIGVIPAIGNQFVIQKVGLTVFGNEYSEVPIDSWGLDELAVARVRSAAGAGTSIRRIAYAAGSFEPYYHPASRLFRDPRGDLTTIIPQIAANSGCTRYVVITKFEGRLDGTNQTLNGVGILNRVKLFNRNALFANIHITVFDGKTFAVRKDPFATVGAVINAAFAKLGGDDNLRVLDDFELPESPEETVHNARLRDGARGMIAEQLDRKLPEYLKE